LSRDIQWTLGAMVVLVNAVVYVLILRSRRKRRSISN
jgi:hypothetical protein